MTGERGGGSPRRSAHSILIVEDDDDLRELLRVFLEIEGFTAMTASDGPQALALLEGALSPGSSLMDVMMPGIRAPLRRSPV
jgi:CheY-like chemotaxis protein